VCSILLHRYSIALTAICRDIRNSSWTKNEQKYQNLALWTRWNFATSLALVCFILLLNSFSFSSFQYGAGQYWIQNARGRNRKELNYPALMWLICHHFSLLMLFKIPVRVRSFKFVGEPYHAKTRWGYCYMPVKNSRFRQTDGQTDMFTIACTVLCVAGIESKVFTHILSTMEGLTMFTQWSTEP